MRIGSFFSDLLGLNCRVFDVIDTGGYVPCPVLQCGESVYGFVDVVIVFVFDRDCCETKGGPIITEAFAAEDAFIWCPSVGAFFRVGLVIGV